MRLLCSESTLHERYVSPIAVVSIYSKKTQTWYLEPENQELDTFWVKCLPRIKLIDSYSYFLPLFATFIP